MNCPRCRSTCRYVGQQKFGAERGVFERAIWCYICGWARREFDGWYASEEQSWQSRPRSQSILFDKGYICTSCRGKNTRKDQPCCNCGNLTFWPDKYGGILWAMARNRDKKKFERYFRERDLQFVERMQNPSQADAMIGAFRIMEDSRSYELAREVQFLMTHDSIVNYNTTHEFVYNQIIAKTPAIINLLSNA